MTDYFGNVSGEWYLISSGIFCLGGVILFYGWLRTKFKPAFSGLLLLLFSLIGLAYQQWKDLFTVGFLALCALLILYTFMIHWNKRHRFK